MKKGLKYIVASCLFITSLGFVSCDNEGIDPMLEDNTMVGKQLVTLNIQGEDYKEREKVFATVDKNREFVLRIDNLGEDGEDYLLINTKMFVVGNFHTNANECRYYSKKEDTWYTTKDILRPNLVTGFVSIDYINKNARTVSGEIKIKSMIPEGSENPNLKQFPINGKFENVVYSRLEKTYFDAFIGEDPMQNSKENLAIVGENLVLSGTDEIGKTQSLSITISKDKVLLPNTKYEQEFFEAEYISPEGVKYVSGKENRKDSFMVVDTVEYESESNKKPLLLKGKFDLVLFKSDDNNVSIRVTEGEFSFEKEKEKAKTK